MGRVQLDKAQVLLTAQRFATPLVAKTTRQVFVGAKRLVPKGDHLSGSGKRRSGQTLNQSLKDSIDVGTRYVTGTVGSSKRYAATTHQGSKPHIIRSERGKQLKFEWDRGYFLLNRKGKRRTGTRFFFFESVQHPGNKRPVRYLTTPLHQFGRLNGFRVTTVGVSRSRLP